MEQRPESEQTPYGEYKGSSSSGTPYGADEMPQSSYPHDGPTPPPQDPYGSTGYQQPPYGQQQYQYQQPGYQPPFTQAGDVGPMERTSLGMKARTAGVLSYLLGWITGIIFILLERENRFVRFHAMQSILLFGGLSILEWITGNLHLGSISGGLGIVQLVCWIVLMVNAGKGKYFKIPIIGDYAERFANQLRV